MDILEGFKYNFRGLVLGLRTPKLFFWGLIRVVAIIFLTVLCAALILVYHEEILNLIWSKPASRWVLWAWYVLSWLLSFILVGLSAVFSYLISQILFSVLIMDLMSRITERKMTGRVREPEAVPLFRLFIYLVKQEIPRTILPVTLSIVILLLGWLTPLGPFLAIFSSGVAVIFLSWDNTDLLPARRLLPFRDRFRLLSRSLMFHLGFGLPFLVPGLNILFLSFAPVGATLYCLDRSDDLDWSPQKSPTYLGDATSDTGRATSSR